MFLHRLAVLFMLLAGLPAAADDWPMFGRDQIRNAVTPEKGAPVDWQRAQPGAGGQAAKEARNIKWSAQLGTMSIGGPVVAGGLVWVGTNNNHPRDPMVSKDAAVLMCFRESDGKFLWQYLSPRLPERYQDGPEHSMGSTPLVEGDRLWVITNRCEALCLDVGPLKRGEGLPKELWKIDMRKQFGVQPHSGIMGCGFAPAPAAGAQRLFVVTGNGVDDSHKNIPAPQAPSVVCFDKDTGKALWQDASPGTNIMRSQRSSPLVIALGGRTQVVVGQGDGWLRSFDSGTGRLTWKCDLNPKGARYKPLGVRPHGDKNYIMATPVLYEGRVYIAPGQDPDHGEGPSAIYCIDPAGEGDVSQELDDGRGKGKPNPNSRVVWRYGGPAGPLAAQLGRDELFNRTQANCTVHDGLVYACDIAGYLHCLDARTGRSYWWHDLGAVTWCAPLWADGKVYMPTEDGDVFIFGHGKEKKLLKTVKLDESIDATPVYANGTLYVMTYGTLYAIEGAKPRRKRPGVGFVPTPHDVVAKMLELARVTKDDVVADLGCGDGRIVVAAAKKYGCRAIGYDLDKTCVRMSRELDDITRKLYLWTTPLRKE
jgi:outer membrane protein assembly factor BamB